MRRGGIGRDLRPALVWDGTNINEYGERCSGS